MQLMIETRVNCAFWSICQSVCMSVHRSVRLSVFLFSPLLVSIQLLGVLRCSFIFPSVSETWCWKSCRKFSLSTMYCVVSLCTILWWSKYAKCTALLSADLLHQMIRWAAVRFRPGPKGEGFGRTSPLCGCVYGLHECTCIQQCCNLHHAVYRILLWGLKIPFPNPWFCDRACKSRSPPLGQINATKYLHQQNHSCFGG